MPPREPRTAGPRRTRTRKARAAQTDVLDVRTSDGWSLRATVDEPAGTPVGVAVLGHAMMARRTEFERPEGGGVRTMLASRGWRVVTFDFRGHGDSGPRAQEGGVYDYDDFVRGDLPAIHAFARARERRRRRVILVGHSLGAHVGLASQGQGLVAFDGFVALGANVWLRELEPLPARWLLKRAVLAAVTATCRRVGRFPARALRLGSDDETRAYFEDFARFARTGRWTARDGADYLAGLQRVSAPVLQVVSDGDRLSCVPDAGARFLARCAGPTELVRVRQADDGSPAPDHMGLVTSGRIASVWDRIEAWMRDVPVARGPF